MSYKDWNPDAHGLKLPPYLQQQVKRILPDGGPYEHRMTAHGGCGCRVCGVTVVDMRYGSHGCPVQEHPPGVYGSIGDFRHLGTGGRSARAALKFLITKVWPCPELWMQLPPKPARPLVPKFGKVGVLAYWKLTKEQRDGEAA